MFYNPKYLKFYNVQFINYHGFILHLPWKWRARKYMPQIHTKCMSEK